jgi:hypothetical protein
MCWWRDLYINRLLGGIWKSKLEKSILWLVKQGEAAAMLGYGLRMLVIGKVCPLPLSSVWVMAAGGFGRNHCCALGFLWEDKAVRENGSRCLADKCMSDQVLLRWEGVESGTYLHVRCLRVLRLHGVSPRWVYVLVGRCVACLICLGIGVGFIDLSWHSCVWLHFSYYILFTYTTGMSDFECVLESKMCNTVKVSNAVLMCLVASVMFDELHIISCNTHTSIK